MWKHLNGKTIGHKESPRGLKTFYKNTNENRSKNNLILAKIQICDLNEMFALKVIFALNVCWIIWLSNLHLSSTRLVDGIPTVLVLRVLLLFGFDLFLTESYVFVLHKIRLLLELNVVEVNMNIFQSLNSSQLKRRYRRTIDVCGWSKSHSDISWTKVLCFNNQKTFDRAD